MSDINSNLRPNRQRIYTNLEEYDIKVKQKDSINKYLISLIFVETINQRNTANKAYQKVQILKVK